MHSRTHPPGPLVTLGVLAYLFPDHAAKRVIVLAFVSALVVVPLWFFARRFTGERGATYAVLLTAVAPAPIVFTFHSMDAVYATMLTTAAALLAWGLGRDRNIRFAFAGGVALGLSTYFTYAGAFIAGFGVLYAVWTSPVKQAIRDLAVAAGGGLVALIFLRVAFGFDLITVYRGTHQALSGTSGRSYVYWVFGGLMVWLTFAGLPTAALGLRELFVERPAYLVALLVPMLVFWFLPPSVTKLLPGETERTWQFAYPFLATAAGAGLARWSSARRPLVVGIATAALVLFTGLQTVLLEALYTNYW